jgi:hypothetical protein
MAAAAAAAAGETSNEVHTSNKNLQRTFFGAALLMFGGAGEVDRKREIDV